MTSHKIGQERKIKILTAWKRVKSVASTRNHFNTAREREAEALNIVVFAQGIVRRRVLAKKCYYRFHFRQAKTADKRRLRVKG